MSELLAQISTAASERSSGVSQVASAVNELDRMTQRNAALVEETAEAASRLHDQAIGLANEVDTFKLTASLKQIARINARLPPTGHPGTDRSRTATTGGWFLPSDQNRSYPIALTDVKHRGFQELPGLRFPRIEGAARNEANDAL